jgi:hypothetical protein
MTYGAGAVRVSPMTTIAVGAVPSPIAPIFTTLLLPGSGWKYWDSATVVGADWQTTTFNDSGWPTGNARFGWGLDGELTPLNPTRSTHYFRRWVNIGDPAPFTELQMELVRDDGAVVYLNGVEVFRSNMPNGQIEPGTLASSTVNTPDETTWYEALVSTVGAGLMSGTNLLAVELHQASANSSDGSFDFALYGRGTTERRLYFGSPVGGRSYAVDNPVPVEIFARAGAGRTISQVELFLNSTNFAQRSSPPYRWTLEGLPLGTHYLMARLTDNLGEAVDSAPVSISVTRELITATLIPAGSVWRFMDSGANLGTVWSLPVYSDSLWSFGPARFGYGNDGEETTVNFGPNSSSKYITTYFRHTFSAPADSVITNLTFRLLRDDGAVVYLNGREQFRSNMPGGTISYTTLASTTAANADEQTYFPTVLTITNLAAGANLVAVEVHQSAGNSSDLGFDMELIGSGYVLPPPAPPMLTVHREGTSVMITWPKSSSGYLLFGSTNLAPSAVWLPVSAPVFSVGEEYVVTLELDGSNTPNTYFRLQH